MTPSDLALLHLRVFTMPRPWTVAEFSGFLADPACFLCHQPGGFLLGRVIADEAELLTLAVAPEARRQGIAAALLAEFLAQSTARGAETAFLEVAADNRAALGLYHAAGFTAVGRRRGYYTSPEGRAIDALVLRCRLPATA
ncbi:ribosomal protein S18-alanine N-acetyltransferase [Rhodobacter ferrooxidans]|uniref:[Ribosomal protein bS18]-alanine N-acetyltransferase n=1 Tax=Rhodobacter ferrooxidans TaxID=371731 RepID=C8RXN1_9RHOB|nr:ribosomal protein S18-alanine N-acetyltransferase [Rhodobacter sp. SW2]EEW26756.1 ribosomal-protein-alanine acetyltransferase [Rhodobacter sp. SW2]